MALHARYSSFDIPASASSQPKNPDKDGIREVAFEDGRHTARMVRMATLPNGRALAGMVRKMIANDDDGLFVAKCIIHCIDDLTLISVLS